MGGRGVDPVEEAAASAAGSTVFVAPRFAASFVSPPLDENTVLPLLREGGV